MKPTLAQYDELIDVVVAAVVRQIRSETETKEKAANPAKDAAALGDDLEGHYLTRDPDQTK